MLAVMNGWLGVEPRHLTALVAVDRTGSFRAAAMELGVVQSAVSQRIAQLERLIGLRLVERSRGQTTVCLTDAGAALTEHADDILAKLNAAFADVRTMTMTPTLHVGAYDGVADGIIPAALRRLSIDAPDLRVTLHEDTDCERFLPRVSSGELDAAFAELPLQPGPFAVRELTLDPYVLLVRADSPLARRRRPPSLAEVSSLPLIAGPGPMLRMVTEHLRAVGAHPRYVFRSQTSAGVQAQVGHGLGAALMPRPAVNENDSRIAVVALEDALPPRRIALCWHRDRLEDDAIMRFLDAVQRTRARPDDADDVQPALAVA
jgi:molybdate transport repressor ModE-like protein